MSKYYCLFIKFGKRLAAYAHSSYFFHSHIFFRRIIIRFLPSNGSVVFSLSIDSLWGKNFPRSLIDAVLQSRKTTLCLCLCDFKQQQNSIQSINNCLQCASPWKIIYSKPIDYKSDLDRFLSVPEWAFLCAFISYPMFNKKFERFFAPELWGCLLWQIFP